MSDEAHLSTEQSRPQPAARIPGPHGNRRRPQGAECAPQPRPQEAQRLTTLQKRSDFLAANAGRRAATPGFVLLVRDRKDGNPDKRVGFTVSRKVGKAVTRNRMKRRLRALSREVIPAQGCAGSDHVMIGRTAGIERPFDTLRADLEQALRRVAR